MEIANDFAPEARRLLTLAREDRRAAEKELAALAPERQAAVVSAAPFPIRRKILDLLPSPEVVVPLIPEAEFCYTCRAIGVGDASWLLPMASNEQIVACFDLDAWSGLQVDLARLDEWMTALTSTDDGTILRAAQALDPEMIVIFLRSHIDVCMKPNPDDDPDWSPPIGSQTLEGQFYFSAKNPKDDLEPVLLMLHALFRGDYWLYFRVIQAVFEELPTENEEWALRWRTGRLEDLGFPSWDTAMRIYGFIRPDRLPELPESENALEGTEGTLPIWISDLPEIREDERALFRATRELSAEERSAVFHAVISLANQVAVADRMELGDPGSLPAALDKATRFASDGLEFLARENGLSLVETLRRVRLERLFRVGANLSREEALPDPIPDPAGD